MGFRFYCTLQGLGVQGVHRPGGLALLNKGSVKGPGAKGFRRVV